MAVSGDELRDAARLVRESVVVGRAVMLARWIGTGRRSVTAGLVLRKADVPAAGAAVGVDVPSRLRTMADIRTLHRPWCVAVATGVLQVGGGWVSSGPAFGCWPPGDADLPRSIDQVAELKVSLTGSRPPIWRRVRLPVTATLADLHDAIQVLFGWDGDHLHVFRAGKKQYSDPFVNLEGTADECAARVRDVLTSGGKISYTYDLGACWEHEIMLERTLARDPSQDYPACVAYKGDSPVEYWSEDDPGEPEPFDMAEVNRELAAFSEAEE